ncbi:TIGR01621 family pseudouridine synthase [Vogesella indigofera]|uniref:TIGR01621 family pseudouridine synthase n=1 Tax=Vogesella indigofera TaxID=45465 RepID=UPI00234EFC9A|nr:TIGR01621 family pseudouridine synthase [Vogesella indigofera]MDC7706048.1 TIGR01621 family pseudouridine synthase [Vogesella indigofera]
MFDLLHTDPRFYVIAKHPGVSFHADGEEAGLMSALRTGLGDDALWPVHRLDRVTSGLLLIARSQQVAANLGAAFAGREVEKYYLALSDAKPAKKQGLIRGDMEKGRGGAWKLCQSQLNPAVTQFFSHSLAPGRRLFLLRPRTGKTHQLRVAMKSLGAPILGDALYGGSAADRTYLHAYALALALDGEALRFVCPPAQGDEFAVPALADYLQQQPPWTLPWPQR